MNGIISETIVFDCLSLWYEENTKIFTVEPKTNEIRWDFKWNSRFVNYNSRNQEFFNKGHTEAQIELEMNGHIINPCIQVYIEKQLVQQLKVNIEIKEYENFLYGTVTNKFHIDKQKTDGTKEDLFNLDYLDPNNDNIIRLAKNKISEIRLTADNEVMNAKLKIFSYYKII